MNKSFLYSCASFKNCDHGRLPAAGLRFHADGFYCSGCIDYRLASDLVTNEGEAVKDKPVEQSLHEVFQNIKTRKGRKKKKSKNKS